MFNQRQHSRVHSVVSFIIRFINLHFRTKSQNKDCVILIIKRFFDMTRHSSRLNVTVTLRCLQCTQVKGPH